MEVLFGFAVLVLALAGLIILLVRLFRRFRTRPADTEPDPLAPLPNLEDLSVAGDRVRVTFAVPVTEEDPILSELLGYYGVEAVRRAKRRLPMEGLAGIEIFVSHRGKVQKVGQVDFDKPGNLPENMPVPEVAKLSEVMDDPLDNDFQASAASTAAGHSEGERLAPLGSVLKIPAQAEAALRLQGVDPAGMTAGELVRGILALRGYTVSPGPDAHTHHARKGSATVDRKSVV